MRNSPVTITPRTAKKYLAKNTKNRPVNVATVEMYADLMRRGLWILNGDVIRFDEADELIDGQHRLMACVLANTSFQSYVVTDLPKGAFDTIDQGKPRRHNDVLAAAGEENYTVLAGALNVLVRLRNPNFETCKPKFAAHDLKALLKANPGLRQSVLESRSAKVIAPSKVAALLYVFGLRDAERAKLFFERVESGLGLTKDMPEYILRQTLMVKPAHGARLSATHVVALTIKAWNAVVDNVPLRSLRYIASEEFPTISGAPAAFQPRQRERRKRA